MTLEQLVALLAIGGAVVAFIRWWLSRPADQRMALSISVFLLGIVGLIAFEVRRWCYETAVRIIYQFAAPERSAEARAAMDAAFGDFAVLAWAFAGLTLLGLGLLLAPIDRK